MPTVDWVIRPVGEAFYDKFRFFGTSVECLRRARRDKGPFVGLNLCDL